MSCFKQLYGLLKENLGLPELSPEPEIIPYDDASYAISWWPHWIYRHEYDELFDLETYAREDGEWYHKRYVQEALKNMNELKQKLQVLFEQARIYPMLNEENIRLKIELVSLREDKEKLFAEVRRLEENLGEANMKLAKTNRQLTNAKKEVT